ncbi:MAG: PEP/pyruvate-binding domain-containing protein [Deltaproteobacteria bacterium]
MHAPLVLDLRDADAAFGNKAAGLARLIAAGLPVPSGFAIATSVFEQVAGPLKLADLDVAGHLLDAAARRIEEAQVPAELANVLRAHLRELGAQVIVRSSSSIEDGARSGGAGVFESSEAVPNELDRVWHAIRAVWTSALAPAAIAYARGRADSLRLGVIVQQFVAGERVTVYTRSPTGTDELVIQRGDTLVRTPRVQIPSDLENHHAVIQALRAERVIGVPADVELVQVHAREAAPDRVVETWVVQARPIVIAPPRAVMTPPPPIVLAPLQDGRVWTWDVTHNPDPLSPAQAHLVATASSLGVCLHELRTCGGYLYASPRPDAHPRVSLQASTDELVGRFHEVERAVREVIFARADGSVAHAVALYCGAFYPLWSLSLSPIVGELKQRAKGGPAGVRPSSIEATIAACARGELAFDQVVDHIGAVSPTWDVATPTFRERPELLRQAIALVEPAPRPQHADDIATVAADLAERDDLLFARAQWMVRSALLALADARGISRDEICWLPIDELAQLDADTAKRKAAGARAAFARAAAWQMPLVVGAPPSSDTCSTDEPCRETLQGVGTGGRVTGRVVRFASLAAAVLASPGDVVVVRAVTPALAVFVGRCAALVSETGGLLDHGAALARELGITCVVGCRDAWTSLDDNDTVDVDGDAGTVTRR